MRSTQHIMMEKTDKVKRLVTQKLQHYFNTERVENEFDCTGRGLHSTTPLVGRLELAYLIAADKPPQKTKKLSKPTTSESDNGNEKKSPQKVTPSENAKRQQSGNRRKRETKTTASGKKKKEEIKITTYNNIKDVNDENMVVSPRVTANSRIKGRVNSGEVNRLAENAESLLTQVPVEKIEIVHRFRQQPVSYEAAKKGKVPHISPNVHAVLNTGNALQYSEEYEERKLAKQYQEKKNKNIKQKVKKSKDHQSPSSFSASSSAFLPLSHGIEENEQIADQQDHDEQVDQSPSAPPGDVHVTIPIGSVGRDEESKTDLTLSKKDPKKGEEKDDKINDETSQGEVGSRHGDGGIGQNIDNRSEDDNTDEEDNREEGIFRANKYDGSIGSNDKRAIVDPFYDNNSFADDSVVISDKVSLKADMYDNESFPDESAVVSDKASLNTDMYDNDSFADESAVVSNKASLNADMYDNDSFAADSTSIVAPSSEMALSEGGMRDANYSDASWEEDDDDDKLTSLDGRNSRMLEIDDERPYRYSPDPDFSDVDDSSSLMSLRGGNRKEKDDGSLRSSRRRGSNASNATMEYIRTESVVSLTELVRSSSIKEEKE